jgi:5-methylcytosine-specific restriction protein A
MHPFGRGQNYDREEVLAFIGSMQPQSGIVYASGNLDYLAVFTGGRSGKRSGYEDGWAPDGTFRYCGQGVRGHQQMTGSNKVLAEHRGVVLLFETWKPQKTWKGKQRFLGEYGVVGYEGVEGRGSRDGDRLLLFSLIPVTNIPRAELILLASKVNIDLAQLRVDAIEAGRVVVPTFLSSANYRLRSATVARYVLARAHNTCEACLKQAPFYRSDGTAFLEIHHTRRLADDGPDDIMHVAAICPNCHREAHFGADVAELRHRLEKTIADKEGELR